MKIRCGAISVRPAADIHFVRLHFAKPLAAAATMAAATTAAVRGIRGGAAVAMHTAANVDARARSMAFR